MCTVMVVSFLSCSNEDKAKRLIKKELQLSLNDYKSYESVEFGTLDTLNSEYTNDVAYIRNERLNKYINELGNSCSERVKENREDISYGASDGEWKKDVLIASAMLYYNDMVYKQTLDSIKSNFIPTFMGFKMTHRFRAKNANGAYILNEKVYYFDKEISSIIELPTEENDKTNLKGAENELILKARRSSWGRFMPK